MKTINYQSLLDKLPIEQAYPFVGYSILALIASSSISYTTEGVPNNYMPFIYLFNN